MGKVTGLEWKKPDNQTTVWIRGKEASETYAFIMESGEVKTEERKMIITETSSDEPKKETWEILVPTRSTGYGLKLFGFLNILCRKEEYIRVIR